MQKQIASLDRHTVHLVFFYIWELSYFSTRIGGHSTVFFWILDTLVYNMYNTLDKRTIRNFPCPVVSLESRWAGLHQYGTSLVPLFPWNQDGQVYINTELPLSRCFLGIKMGRFTSIRNFPCPVISLESRWAGVHHTELCLLIYSTYLLILGIQLRHVFGRFPRCDSQQSTACTFSAASSCRVNNWLRILNLNPEILV
jgi:hypothetical protein